MRQPGCRTGYDFGTLIAITLSNWNHLSSIRNITDHYSFEFNASDVIPINNGNYLVHGLPVRSMISQTNHLTNLHMKYLYLFLFH